jgi:hypothetical protein
VAPRPANEGHRLPYAVRGFVLAGAFTVIEDTNATTHRPGEVFMVAAGRVHSEEVGPKYWWGANIDNLRRCRLSGILPGGKIQQSMSLSGTKE